jgi:spore coat protein A, manganese oxidase
MRQFQAKVHRDIPPTTLWGYDGSSPGPTFETRSGEPVLVEWINALPTRHLVPVDHTLHGAEADKPEVCTIVHVHGARTGPESDGYPENWFVPGKSALSYYPNSQDAATLFYHDHAMGITRLNTVAGLFGLYIVRDCTEDAFNLPKGPYDIPLLIYDRSFTEKGELHYPASGDPGAPWISEYLGNAILVNGALFPYLDVEPRRYRFRIVNTANTGFYDLSVSRQESMLGPGEPFIQIGSDQGLLASPVELKSLSLAPGERADVVLDFRKCAGKALYLRTDASLMMNFRVARSAVQDSSSVPNALHPIARIPAHSAVRTRELTLGHHEDRLGHAKVMLLNRTHWSMPVTEKPVIDTTEIWNLVNLTDDSHPIHLHLVRFQILDRRPFDLQSYVLKKKLIYTGPPVPPEPNEMGWKDTVRTDPMVATRIIVRFEGFTGRYVWHCHILEHEDNEMMRPYDIVPQPT